jgi:hypothetical protein
MLRPRTGCGDCDGSRSRDTAARSNTSRKLILISVPHSDPHGICFVLGKKSNPDPHKKLQAVY